MPETINSKINQNKLRWLPALAAIFFILPALAAAGSFIFDKIYQAKIYPNIFIGHLNLGGQTVGEARKLINLEINKISQIGVVFSYKSKPAIITPVLASADGDLAISIINFNADKAAEAALNYGRQDNWFINSGKKISLLINKKIIPLEVSANKNQAEKILADAFAKTFQPAADARLEVKKRRLPASTSLP